MKSTSQEDRIRSLVGNNGGTFESDNEAREYFRVRNIVRMFGECSYSQTDLDCLCETMIDGKDVQFADLFDEEVTP